jgi:WD40 repeat protein
MVRHFLLVLCALAVIHSGARAQAPAGPRKDLLGDSLPAGAISRLGTLRFKHFNQSMSADLERPASRIIDAVLSPEGSKIASLAYDGPTLRIWDSGTGKELPGPWTELHGSREPLTFSADGKILASTRSEFVSGQFGGGGPTRPIPSLMVWDTVAARLLHSIDVKPEAVTALAFASGGKTLVSAGQSTVRWWDVTSGKQVKSWKPFADEVQPVDGGKKTKALTACALSPRGRFLAVTIEGGEAIVFDLDERKQLWRAKGAKPTEEMLFAFSGDENWLALTVESDKLELRNAATGKQVDIPPIDPQWLKNGEIGALALSSDGMKMAVGAGESNILVWNKAEPKQFRAVPSRIIPMSSNSLARLAFSPDDKMLMACLGTYMPFFDTATLTATTPWEGHRGWVDRLSFSRDGKQLLSGSATMNLHPKEWFRWDTATWTGLSMTSTQTSKWRNIGIISPDYSVFAGRNFEDQQRIYDHTSGKLLGSLSKASHSISGDIGLFSPSSKFYLQAGQDEQARPVSWLYSIPSCKLKCKLPAMPSSLMRESAHAVAFSADERMVAMFSRNRRSITVCDTDGGKVLRELGKAPDDDGLGGEEYYQDSSTLAFSPDNRWLASFSTADGMIRIWDLRSARERQLLPAADGAYRHATITWSPDSRVLAVADREIQLWEVATVKVRRVFQGHGRKVLSLAFSADGRFLASGSTDTTVFIWDVWGR